VPFHQWKDPDNEPGQRRSGHPAPDEDQRYGLGAAQGSQRLAQIRFEAHGREACHREHDHRDVENDLDAHDSVQIMTINLMLNASDLPESRGSPFPAESALQGHTTFIAFCPAGSYAQVTAFHRLYF
jgi:hypothetical protein